MAVKLVTDSALNKAMNLLTGDRDMILNVYDPAAGRRQVAFSDDLPTAEEKAAWNDSDVFIATYGTTTSAEIEAAYQDGKIVLCKDNARYYFFCGNLNTMLFTTAMPDTAVKGSEGTLYWVSPKASDTGGWAKGRFNADPNTHASTHASGGADPITPASIGAATMGEVNSAIQSAIGSAIGGSY